MKRPYCNPKTSEKETTAIVCVCVSLLAARFEMRQIELEYRSRKGSAKGEEGFCASASTFSESLLSCQTGAADEQSGVRRLGLQDPFAFTTTSLRIHTQADDRLNGQRRQSCLAASYQVSSADPCSCHQSVRQQ